MTQKHTPSQASTLTSEMVKLRRDKFVLLAKVGQRKKEASQFRDEAMFYYGTVTELLVALGEAMALLREMHPPESGNKKVSDLMCQHTQLIKQLLSFWPQHSESQERALALLDSAGLGMVTGLTEDGYVIPSTALILENVERIIAATKAQNQKPSSD